MAKTLTIQTICSLLILLFAYTGLSKLMEHSRFVSGLQTVVLLRDAYQVISWGIPLSELVLAALLIFANTRLYGLYGSAVLLLVFTLYIAYMLLYIPDRPCSCGGVIASLTWPQHLVFNIFFLLLAVSGILLSKRTNSKEQIPNNK